MRVRARACACSLEPAGRAAAQAEVVPNGPNVDDVCAAIAEMPYGCVKTMAGPAFNAGSQATLHNLFGRDDHPEILKLRGIKPPDQVAAAAATVPVAVLYVPSDGDSLPRLRMRDIPIDATCFVVSERLAAADDTPRNERESTVVALLYRERRPPLGAQAAWFFQRWIGTSTTESMPRLGPGDHLFAVYRKKKGARPRFPAVARAAGGRTRRLFAAQVWCTRLR